MRKYVTIESAHFQCGSRLRWRHNNMAAREERWLGETFGPAYQRYRDEVAALIPFLL